MEGNHPIGQFWCSSYWYTTRWEGRREHVLRKQFGTQWCVAIHSWSPSHDSSTSGQRWVLVHWSFTEQPSNLFTHPPITLTTSPHKCSGSLSAEKERSKCALAPTAVLTWQHCWASVCVCVCVCVRVRVCVCSYPCTSKWTHWAISEVFLGHLPLHLGHQHRVRH